MNGPGVVIAGADLEAAYYCTAREIRRRELACEQVDPAVRGLFDRLDAAVRMSVAGHESTCREAQLTQDELIGPKAAAEIIGCTPRHVRRIRAYLGGIPVEGAWVFKCQTVLDYASERRAA